VRLVGKAIKRLDLSDPTTRKNLLKIDSNPALDLLFGLRATD